MEETQKDGEGKQPDGPLFAPQRADDLSSHLLRQAMGYLGLLLPLLVYLVAGWRSSQGFPGWRPLDSVSEYYHSGSVAILTGVLWAVGAFLFTYRGYDNPSRRWDLITGKVASVAALCVALFPTAALPPLTAPPWWDGWMRTVHYVSAFLLFGCFVVYSLLLFPLSSGPSGSLPDDKRARNLVYRSCGVGMLGLLIWVAVAGLRGGPIFVPESLALMLFGISWLTKGRALWTLREAVTRIADRRRSPPSAGPSPGP